MEDASDDVAFVEVLGAFWRGLDVQSSSFQKKKM